MIKDIKDLNRQNAFAFFKSRMDSDLLPTGIFLIIWGTLVVFITCVFLYKGDIEYGAKGDPIKKHIYEKEEPIKFYILSFIPSIIGSTAIAAGVFLIKRNKKLKNVLPNKN